MIYILPAPWATVTFLPAAHSPLLDLMDALLLLLCLMGLLPPLWFVAPRWCLIQPLVYPPFLRQIAECPRFGPGLDLMHDLLLLCLTILMPLLWFVARCLIPPFLRRQAECSRFGYRTLPLFVLHSPDAHQCRDNIQYMVQLHYSLYRQITGGDEYMLEQYLTLSCCTPVYRQYTIQYRFIVVYTHRLLVGMSLS